MVQVIVAKIQDSANANSTLPSPHNTNDYSTSGLNADANAKQKGAVLKYQIENHNPAVVNVSGFADSSGALVYEINAGGYGAALQKINLAVPQAGNKIRVVLVNKLKSVYRLAEASAAGATQIKVTAGSVFISDTVLKFGSDYVKFVSQTSSPSGATVTIEVVDQYGGPKLYPAGHALAGQPFQLPAHAAGDEIEFSAAGWSSDPIIILVENMSAGDVKTAILHEVGHRIPPVDFGLDDVADVPDDRNGNPVPTGNATSIMHYRLGGKADCLRYLPRALKYDNPTGNLEESQWEKIDRS
jgi:hypothetical protein